MKRIKENTEVIYTSESELSYKDNEKKDVELYVNDELIGHIEVWTDRENENREYIIISNEIIYLDSIKKR